MNLTDWRETDQRFSTFYRCENDEEQEWYKMCKTIMGMPNGQQKPSWGHSQPSWDENMNQYLWTVSALHIWQTLDGGSYRQPGETSWKDPSHLRKYTLPWEKGQRTEPGSNGIGLEFHKTNWSTIKDDISATINQMFTERKVSTQQKHGVIVCLPKSSETTTPGDFRPIALLNTDYKILAA